MKQKLFYLGCCFVFMWTIGEVTMSTYSQNIVSSISMTIAYAIYLGMHQMAWKGIKRISLHH